MGNSKGDRPQAVPCCGPCVDIQDVVESTFAACGQVRAPSLLCEEILHLILAERLRSDGKRF